MAAQSEFFIHVQDEEKNLYVTRTENIKSDALSPCCMTPDDVDYEMSKGKNPEMLRICGMNQQSFEYFVLHYGKTYRYLDFFKCQLISDFSPLSDLARLERVDIFWNIRTDRLWDMSRNAELHTVAIDDCKRMTYFPDLLRTAPHLKHVFMLGSAFNNTPMASMDWAAKAPALESIYMRNIKLEDRDMSFLDTLPTLRTFHFPAGMLTTEEIARIVAKYPGLQGQSLKAFNKEDAILTDVRVCGYRKPGLDLPRDQKRLDKYIAQFDALVEKYRSEA